MILAAALLALQPAPPSAQDINDAAVGAYRDCVIVNARRYAAAPDAADLVARAALAACGGEKAEAERTMYGTRPSSTAVVERTMVLLQELMLERAIREVVETRLPARR